MVAKLLNAVRHDWRSGLALGRARDIPAPRGGTVWLLVWALACLAIGAGLYRCCGYQGGFVTLNAAASQLPDAFWQVATVLGDERMAFALGLILARRRPQVFWSLILAGLIAAAYTQTLKPLFEMPRPPAVLAADGFHLIGHRLRHEAFPSGHSVTAAVFFGTLVFYARGSLSRLALLGLAVLAGLSRVAVGVHWPIDVAAGLLGGALAVVIGAWLSQRASWGVEDVSIHLALVTLAAIMATALLFWDGGYPAAAPFQYAVGAGVLSYTLFVYCVLPVLSWVTVELRRRRPDTPPPAREGWE